MNTDQRTLWLAGVACFGTLFGGFAAVKVWTIDDWATHPWYANALKSGAAMMLGWGLGWAWGIGLAWWIRRRTGRLSPGHCRCCGYDLQEGPTKCPECGADVAPDL